MVENSGIPAGLPMLAAGCSAADLDFRGGDAFWEGLEERVAACGLDAVLDQALGGRPAPRVWVLVHEPGRPQLAVAAALGFARALADRGQAALVLDGDDQATTLSGWAGRLDTEGWIDTARYGCSLLGAGVALPFAGRTAYLVGVGTYAPTDVTGDELGQLLARLRRQADDILVVLPGGAGAAAWAQRADIRLLCHDQAALTPPKLAAVVANLAAAGVAPTALLGFGQAAVEEAADQAVAEEEIPASAGAEPDEEAEPAAEAPVAAAPAAADGPAPAERRSIGADEASVHAALAALEEQDAAGGQADDVGLDPEIVYARRRGTSGVFWGVAAAAVVLIGLVGVYYVRYVRVPEDGLFGAAPVQVVQAPDTGRTVDQDAALPPVIQETTGPAAADTATVGGGIMETADQAAAPDSVPVVAADTGSDAVRDDAQGAVTPPQETAAPPAQAQQETAQAPAPAADAQAAPTRPAFDPAPYRVPVGTGGWALQVYSLRDSTSAQKEIRRLERLGMRAASRIVELPDSGRWWRIYVGSFASRNDARAAEPALFERLRTDWAQPTRFTVAVTDTAGR